jgi:nitrite reductase/ring-hydroxylating ferredoxin subunit
VVPGERIGLKRHIIGSVDTVPPGAMRRVEVGSRGILVSNVDGQFYALFDRCPHQGARLSAGVLVGGVVAKEPGCYSFDPASRLVKCPRHGWEYELATGRSWYDPQHSRVRAYDVSVQSGADLTEQQESGRVPGSLVAETISISIEDDYLVVEF